jgi:phage gp45-like
MAQMMDMRGLIKYLGKMERKLSARLRSIVRRGVMSNLVADSQGQTGQTSSLADDARDGVELFEPYGFTSSPQAGAECLVFSVGGDSAHQVALAAGDRTVRLVVAQGEVAVYHEGGSRVLLLNDGSIEVYPEEGQVVRLGGAGGLAIARATDPVHMEAATSAWVSEVTTAIGEIAAFLNVAGPLVGAPGLVTPLAAAVVEPFARINAGGIGSEST